jgi:hypothetical protein
MLDIRSIRLQNELEILEDNEDKIPLNVKYKVLNQSNILIQIQGLPGTCIEGTA